MATQKTHWSSLFTLIVFGFGLLVLLLAAAGLGLSSFVSLFSGAGTATAEMIGSFAFGFQVVLLLICAWFVLQKMQAKESAEAPLQFPFALWQAVVAIVIPLVAALIGGLLTLTGIEWLIWLTLPFLTLLVIIPPIWLFFGVGSNGIEAGPRWRFFATFGISLTAAPAIMLVLELVVLILSMMLAALYLAVAQPAFFEELLSLSQALMSAVSEEELFNLLSPYVTHPAVIFAGLSYIAVLVPLIEEFFKPLAVWIFAAKIDSPAQGFVLGMASGAAFGLFESLNASADGSTSWAVIVAARAGTSLLHITTSGLVGWGITSAFKEKKFARLAGAYFAATLIHGIWNAAAVGAGITAIGESIGRPEWLYNYAPAMICGLLVMGVGVFTVLLIFNRKIGTTSSLPETEETREEKVQSTL